MPESGTANQAPIMGGLHHITDIEAASDFEKKHTPWLSIERTEDGLVNVRVEVGHYFPHPNEPGHYIQWIHLYADEANIAQFDFSAGVSWPKCSIAIDVPAGTKITAIENCNLHGLWKAEATV